MNRKHKRALRGSILLSICLHFVGIAFFQRQSLWFSSPPSLQATESPWIASMGKMEKDQILKEAFKQPPPSSSQEAILTAGDPKKETLTAPSFTNIPLPPIEEESQFLSSLAPPLPFPENELLASSHILSFTLPPEQRINLFEHLPKNLITLKSSHPVLAAPTPPPRLPSPQIALESTQLPAPPEASLQALLPESTTLPTMAVSPEKPILAQAPAFIPAPNLPNLPSLQDLQTISYSNAFDTELVFSEREEGGYIFALTLIPRRDLNLSPLKQNYLFLIDRSNSIQSDRLIATKSAVRKALEEITEGDTFNIYTFDSKVEKLSPTQLICSQEALSKAADFLDNIELGSFFSQADLLKPLFLTIPSTVSEDELFTAILITDGENFSKKGSAHTILHDWTRYNNGKVSLFTIGMNGDSHLSSLSAATAFNRGKVFTSPTNRGLKRKLMKLMKTIHAPVSKNLSCKAISRTPHASIELFPRNKNAPHLYLGEPYVILGKTDSMEDFILFVQGRLNGQWLHIKKTVSFLNGKRGKDSLQEEWALQKSYGFYEEYLLDNNPRHLAEAKLLLEPLDLKAPFE